MAVTAKFIADFSSFSAATAKAEIELRTFETGATKAQSALQRMANSLSGTRLIQDATLAAEAVQRVGGVSTLTDKELQRLGVQAQEAAQKMQRLGLGVPENLREIITAAEKASNATKQIGSSVDGFSKALSISNGLLATFGASLSIGALVGFGRNLLQTASQIADLSAATGVSKQNLQELGYIGTQVGVGMDEIGRAVGTLSERLAGGDQNAADAVARLGLNLQTLIASGPTEAFIAIGDAIGRLTDPMERNAVAADVFGGKLSKDLIPLLGNLRQSMSEIPKDAIISDRQIEQADKFGDALDRLMIRMKAFAFRVISAKDTQELELAEIALDRLAKTSPATATALQQVADQMKASSVATHAATDYTKQYADTVGTVKGYVQGASEVEKIHAEMLEFSQRQAEKAADAQRAWRLSVENATIAQNLSVFSLNKFYQAVIPIPRALTAADVALDHLDTTIVGLDPSLKQFNVNLNDVGKNAKSLGALEPEAKKAESGLKDLSQAFATLAQVSGDSFGGVLRAIGQVISTIDVLHTATKNLGELTGTATDKMVTGFTNVLSVVGVLQSLDSVISGFLSRNVAGQDRMWDDLSAAIVRSTKAYNDLRFALPITEAQRLADKIVQLNGLNTMDPKNWATVRRLIGEIDTDLGKYVDLAAAARSAYGPTLDQAREMEQRQFQILQWMLRQKASTGEQAYSQEQLNKAYYDWQKAMAAAGNDAAAAWVKWQDAVLAGADPKIIEALAEAMRQAGEAGKTAGEDTGDKMDEGAKKAASSFDEAAQQLREAFGASADGAVSDIEDIFRGLEVHVRVVYDIEAPELPPLGPQAPGRVRVPAAPSLLPQTFRLTAPLSPRATGAVAAGPALDSGAIVQELRRLSKDLAAQSRRTQETTFLAVRDALARQGRRSN